MNDIRLEERITSEFRVVAGSRGLAARGVGKTYRKRPVVRNVSIELRRGEAVGLLGPNGAGKTTTFYMIVGLVKPDTGAINLDGADITSLPMYRRARLGIGYLPQEASGAGWRSPARSQPSRPTYFWMSRWPASIQSR